MQLPSKVKLENLGLQSFPMEGNKTFKIIAVNDKDFSQSGCIGIEFETRFQPTGRELRQMKTFFVAHKLLSLEESTNQLAIEKILKREIMKDISELIVSEIPKRDGGGIELRFHAATHAAWKETRSEIQRIIRILKAFGFSDQFGFDGIHANIDKALFGTNKAVQRRSFANFIWFLYNEQDFMSEFCSRARTDEGYSDMMTLLGDRFGNLTAQEKLDVFLNEKNVLLDSIESGELGDALNIQVNKHGRPTAEFRWFGSTHSMLTFMSYIDFGFAMGEYCQAQPSPRNIGLRSFSEFVTINQQTYGDLYTRMCRMAFGEKVMKKVQHLGPKHNKHYRYKTNVFHR